VITVAAVDDHPVVLSGLTATLARVPGIRLVATEPSVEALLAGPGRYADVILLDLDLGDGSRPPDTIRRLANLDMAVAVFSALGDARAVRAAIKAGAAAFIPKSDGPEELATAIRAVASGGGWLSPQVAFMLATDDTPDRPELSEKEREALSLYATGMAMKAVGRRMGISPETAKQYIDRVRRKYREAGRDAGTKVALYQRAVEDGYIDPSQPGPGGAAPPPSGRRQL